MATDLAARTLRTEEFPSGTVYGYVLPDVARMLYSGIFPATVLSIMKEALQKPSVFAEHELSDDEQRAWDEGRARVAAWMIRSVDGEESVISWEQVVDSEQFPDDDFTAFWMRALRMVSAPKAKKEPTLA